DVLLVDAVLAVGDAAFQKKCLGKIGEAGRDGRTVVFASPNMSAVQALCRRGIVLEGGRLAFEGPANEAVARYLASQETLARRSLGERTDRHGDGAIRFVSATVEDASGRA